jgi:hypothetical protein
MTDEALTSPTANPVATPVASSEPPPVVVSDLSGADLQAARRRRAGLRRLCSQLGEAFAAADARQAADREGLVRALGELAECWSRHVADTEAPDGLLNQILTDAPRLATTVDKFRREHPGITARIVTVSDRLADPTADRADLEPHVMALLTAIDRHRAGGGELIHRAYNIDIGLGE